MKDFFNGLLSGAAEWIMKFFGSSNGVVESIILLTITVVVSLLISEALYG